MKVVLDSSALIEMLLASPRGADFRTAAEKAEAIVVPAVCLQETWRFVAAHLSPEEADAFAESLQENQVLDLDAELALASARIGRAHELALADSMVYATALAAGAELWTQDADFKNLPSVRYLPKKG